MGDTGSLFLGYTLAAVAIKLRVPDNSPFVTWMVPASIKLPCTERRPLVSGSWPRRAKISFVNTLNFLLFFEPRVNSEI